MSKRSDIARFITSMLAGVRSFSLLLKILSTIIFPQMAIDPANRNHNNKKGKGVQQQEAVKVVSCSVKIK